MSAFLPLLVGLLPLLVSSIVAVDRTPTRDLRSPVAYGMSAMQSEAPLQIELDVFSGRPNPTWELTTEEAIPLIDQLVQATERSSGETPTVLGYRGLLVQGQELRARGWDRLAVGGGVIVAHAGLEEYRYSDEGRGFECRLLSTGEGRLSTADYETFLLLAFPEGIPANCGEPKP